MEEWQNYKVNENPELESIQNDKIRVSLVSGDISLEKTNAILLPANESLIMNTQIG